jgi:hypothetical protein
MATEDLVLVFCRQAGKAADDIDLAKDGGGERQADKRRGQRQRKRELGAVQQKGEVGRWRCHLRPVALGPPSSQPRTTTDASVSST